MDKRFWYPFTFKARSSRLYRVSFLIAEEATWDHRFHDLDGRELNAARLNLTRAELCAVQVGCDGAVGSTNATAVGGLRSGAVEWRDQAAHAQSIA